MSENVILLHGFVAFEFPKLSNLGSKHSLYKKVLKGTYNDQKMRHLLSDYNKTIEEFLAFYELKHNKETKELLTYKSLTKYSGNNIVSEKKRAIQKLFEKNVPDSSNIIHDNMVLEELSYEFNSKNQKLETNSNLQELSNSIDRDFLHKKLKYSCELMTRKNVLSKDYDFSFLESILEYGKTKFSVEDPIIYAYYRIILLIQNHTEEDYHFLRKYVFEHINRIPKRDMRDMHVFIINHCIRQSNLGQIEYQVELFNLYKDLLKHEVIINDSALNLHDYKNIGTIAILLKEFNWLDRFSEEHTPHLKPIYRITARGYNLARINFNKGLYKEALRELHGMEHTDLYYDLGERALLVKIYFELDDFELFNANLNSFRIFIERNKLISQYQKKLYKAFLKWIKRVYNLREGKVRNLRIWLDEVENTKEIADRAWILEKMSEVK